MTLKSDQGQSYDILIIVIIIKDVFKKVFFILKFILNW